MKKFINLIFFLLCINIFNVYSQDLHFSQYYSNPLNMNPALSGTFNNDLRAILSYKDQWKMLDNGFKTYSLNCDGILFKQKTGSGFTGGGIAFNNDKAGASELTTTNANISISYHLKINKNNFFSVGFQGGFIQKGINQTNLQWDNQYDGYNYNSLINPNENIKKDKIIIPDISVGGAWTFNSKGVKESNENSGIISEFGIAMFHVNKPEYSFYNTSGDNILMRFVSHGNLLIGINSLFAIVPSFEFMKQGNSKETILGSAIKIMAKETSGLSDFKKNRAISIGGYYRFKDAFICSILLETKNIAMGISYDVNISDLKIVTNKNGGLEVMIRYTTANPLKNRHGNSLL